MSTASFEDQERLRKIRKKAVGRFILMLSDTQLATGLAILCDGILNRKSITEYTLHIILAQAWLDSTTYLATLDALRNDLRSHGLIRDTRVCCMMLLFLLLTAAFVMCQMSRWYAVGFTSSCMLDSHH